MRCVACNRPLLAASVTIKRNGGVATYGPVCARAAFPELYGKRTRIKLRPVDTRVVKDDSQLELELTA